MKFWKSLMPKDDKLSRDLVRSAGDVVIAGTEAYATPNATEWIDLRDKVPEDNCPILATDGNSVWLDEMDPYLKAVMNGEEIHPSGRWYHFTHWMYCPPLPK